MIKKLDIKSWMILILLSFTLFFGYKWFFSVDGESKAIIEQLEEENDVLDDNIKINIDLISTLEVEISNLSEIIDLKESIISNLDLEVNKLGEQVRLSKVDLDNLRKELDKKREKIVSLTNNPSKKTGDELLDSLREKLNN